MEAIIEKYNYMSGTEGTESKLKDELHDAEDDILETINLDKLKKSFAALTKKICVKGYPVRTTPPHYMASLTISCLGRIIGYVNCLFVFF